MGKYDPLLLQAIKLLSMRVAILEPFYHETACLNPAEREIIGYAEAYIELFGENDPLSIMLRVSFIPALKKIGVAKWPRLELTDLGFAISDRDTETEDISEEAPLVLEETIGEIAENQSDSKA